MCFNSNASAVSFITGMTCSVVLLYYNVPLAIFYMFVSLMQLYDFIFWNNLEKNTINHTTTKIAMISNNIQPIVLAIATYVFKKKLGPISLALTVLYTLIVIPYTAYNWNNVQYTLVSKKSYPSLYWEWLQQRHGAIVYSIYLITTSCIFLENFAFPVNILVTILFYMTYVISYLTYYKTSSIGRMWCYFAGFVPLFVMMFYIR